MITKEELRETTHSSKRIIKFPPAIGDWTTLKPQKPSPKKVRRGLYNFDRISEVDLKTAHLLHYRSFDQILAVLQNDLSMSTDLYSVSADQVSYLDFVESTVSPVVQISIHFGNSRAPATLFMDLHLALEMIHRALGFRGLSPASAHGLTEKESHIVQTILNTRADSFGGLWTESIGQPNFELYRSTTFSPDSTASPMDTFVVFEAEVILGESAVGKMSIGYLAPLLRTLIEKVKKNQKARPLKFWLPGPILSKLNGALTAILGQTTISASELGNLEVGDVLMLDTTLDQLVSISIGDKEVLRGVPGTQNGKMAVRCYQRTTSPEVTERPDVIGATEEIEKKEEISVPRTGVELASPPQEDFLSEGLAEEATEPLDEEDDEAEMGPNEEETDEENPFKF